jgi:ribonuclease III
LTFFKKANALYQKILSKEDRELAQAFKRITGKTPVNLSLYKQATRHASMATKNAAGIKDSYERLEYLGDAILGMVVAELLFAKYPYKEEGFLTELRSRLVSREALNELSRKVGVANLVQFDHRRGPTQKAVYGDAMEALIGAVYLDLGFNAVKQFILTKLVAPHFDFDHIQNTTINYKSKLIEWAQRNGKPVQFDMIADKNGESGRFVIEVIVAGEPLERGYGFNKKKAEQDAARKSLEMLKIHE